MAEQQPPTPTTALGRPRPVARLVARAAPDEPLVDRARSNFYFRILVHLGVPMSVSFGVHLLIFFALAFLATWQVIVHARTPADYDVSIVGTGADAGGSFVWSGDHALTDSITNLKPLDDAIRLSDMHSALDDLPLNKSSENSDDGGGFGLGEAGRSGILGVGSGASGSGGEGLGAGLGTGAGLGQVGLWDIKAGGNKIVYVVDFSGSITPVADDLRRELKRSIGALQSSQTFEVVLFFSNAASRYATESFAAKLTPAEVDNKRKFFDWIQRHSPNGATNPMPAILRALALKPEVLFLISDGGFDDPPQKVLDDIRNANRVAKAKINCLVFDEVLFDFKPGSGKLTEGAKVLQQIAQQHGGKCKIVTESDLGRR